MPTREREARLEQLFAAGWTTGLFAEFWAAPDLKFIPSIITDDIVGYWDNVAWKRQLGCLEID